MLIHTFLHTCIKPKNARVNRSETRQIQPIGISFLVNDFCGQKQVILCSTGKSKTKKKNENKINNNIAYKRKHNLPKQTKWNDIELYQGEDRFTHVKMKIALSSKVPR